ncbi:hypothetical protein ACWKWU_08565 [Chitinophaga lutea]
MVPQKLLAKLLSLLLIVSLFSFRKIEDKEGFLLVYDKWDNNQKIHFLLVSDFVTYEDWEANKLKIAKRFAAVAMEKYGIEVWEPGIKADGLYDSEDAATIARGKKMKSHVEYYTDEKSTGKAFLIKLNRSK